MSYSAQTNLKADNGAKSVAQNVGEVAAEYAGIAGKKVEQAIGSAESTVRSMADQGKEAGERVQEVAGNLKGAVQKSVKDQPMATLAVAAAVGFVVGALWKS
jgi:ElaB/YqjD/DUF883 family membrane-anchored ribosome-binding protein